MKITLILILFLSINPIFAQEEEECIFDQSTQTDDFIKNKGRFSDYEWDNEKKEATIKLQDGNILTAFRGGCVHFGMSGELEIINNSIELSDLYYWLEKALWIANSLFEDSDIKFLENQISKENYSLQSNSNSIYIFIPHEYYNEFSISVRMENGKAFLYVGYYFS